MVHVHVLYLSPYLCIREKMTWRAGSVSLLLATGTHQPLLLFLTEPALFGVFFLFPLMHALSPSLLGCPLFSFLHSSVVLYLHSILSSLSYKSV